MSSLATISSGDLRKMSDRELTDGLAGMSPNAIDRFRRMRRLSPTHDQALDTFLRQNPEKRLTAGPDAGAAPKAVKAKTKSPSKLKTPVGKPKIADDGYVQLWVRMRAWWDGSEPGQPVRRANDKVPPKQMEIQVDADDRVNHRLKIIQQLWGEATSLPGGKEFTLDLLQAAKPTKAMVIADLTSGLGAGTWHLAGATGATVNGFEIDKELADEGQRLSQLDQQNPKPSISHLDIGEMAASLEKEHYDIIVARDFLYAQPDPKAVLSVIADALKHGGSLIFTDFCLSDRSTENVDVLAWRQAEPRKPTPATVDEYRDLFATLRFEIKSVDDVTSIYIPAIQKGWKAIVEALKTSSPRRGFIDSLMQEGKVWLSRSKAMESGQLRVVKIHAVMKKAPKRSLTDSMSLD